MSAESLVFTLPDVGEGLTEAEILTWHVRPGDVVVVNQVIVEIETAKASVELPCPFAGTVQELHAPEGSIVLVGSPIISILAEPGTATGGSVRQPVLVGYGVREQVNPSRRARRTSSETITVSEPVTVEPAAASGPVRAKPLVRRLARDKGVELSSVTPTGANGDVTRADILAAIGQQVPDASAGTSTREAATGERVPVRGVQRAMAEAMVQSAFTAPHVTEWVDLDMTRAMEVVHRLREHPSAADVRVSPMILVAAGLIRAAQRYPRINSTWVDTDGGAEVVIHGAVHLGIAADTPRGLLVPTIRNASALTLIDLARSVQDLIEAARAGRSTPADLTGGTITLTNVGVFGVDGGTPILNPGQTAILAMGRIIDRAWVVDGQVVARPVMQLSLSFDHRVVDGALGSRALQSVAEFLSDPALSLLMDSGLA